MLSHGEELSQEVNMREQTINGHPLPVLDQQTIIALMGQSSVVKRWSCSS